MRDSIVETKEEVETVPELEVQLPKVEKSSDESEEVVSFLSTHPDPDYSPRIA